MEKEDHSVDGYYLFNSVSSYPVTEYLESSNSLQTPSFVLTVTWPRVVLFYHPSSPVCQDLRESFIHLAREIHHRSLRVPVAFHAISCQVYRALCDDLEIETVPHLLAYPSGSIKGLVLQRTPDNAFDTSYVADLIRIELEVENKEEEPSERRGDTNNDLSSTDADARLFFRHLLDKISKLDRLTPSASHAFKEWLDLLHWTLPSRDFAGLHNLINDLRDNCDWIAYKPSTVSDILREYGESMLPTIHHSAKCDDNCAYWKFMHVVSVGMVEQHNSVLGNLERISVPYAAHVLTDMTNEFELEQTGMLLKMYDQCWRHEDNDEACSKKMNDPHSWEHFVLWLWEVHNGVQRVEDRPLWPLPADCPLCYRAANNEGLWNKPAVYDHITKEYWPRGLQNQRLVVLDSKHKSRHDVVIKSSGVLLLFGLVGMCLVWYSKKRLWIETGRQKKVEFENRAGRRGRAVTSVQKRRKEFNVFVDD